MRTIEALDLASAGRAGWLAGAFMRYPAAVATDNVKARLVSEVRSVAPGQSFWVALELDIRDGWHTYWRNPGDSGQATKARLDAAAGLCGRRHRLDDAAPLRAAAAGQLRLCEACGASGANHGPRICAPGGHRSARKASWLVCSDVCIPESADLQLKSAGRAPQAGAIDTASRRLFAARAELPIAAPAASAASRTAAGHRARQADWGATLAQIKDLSSSPTTTARSSTPHRRR
jgi:hypothetical protein